MTCALIVFYLIGYHTRADVPPIRTTLMEAQRLITSPHHNWTEIGVYPVIEPCA